MRKRFWITYLFLTGFFPMQSLALSCVQPNFEKRFNEYLHDPNGVALIGAMHKKDEDAYHFFGRAFRGGQEIAPPNFVANKIIPLGQWHGDLITPDILRIYFAKQNPKDSTEITFESRACGNSTYNVNPQVLRRFLP